MTEPDALAPVLKDWRARHKITQADAAELLGIPLRTLDGIEQGRVFRYREMLLLAVARLAVLLAMGPGDDAAADARSGGQGAGDQRRHAEGHAEGRRDPVHQHRPRSKARNAALRSR